MNIKALALAALRPVTWYASWRYWGKKPAEVLRMRREKLKRDKQTRRRRKCWGWRARRYPAHSHRRTS